MPWIKKNGEFVWVGSGGGGSVSVDSTLSVSGAAADAAAVGERLSEVSKEIADKVSKTGITLGLHSDGKYYVFVDGAPVGTGFELSGTSGDVFGYVDENNNIVLNGNLADGSYSIKYETEDENGNITIIDIGDLVLDSNVYYSVTNTLTNCTSDNSATQLVEGDSYSATITANDGYELSSVVVTMGGTDVSASAVSGGSISIASVTGDIVITAVAEEKQAAEPVTVDIELRDGIRLGSDGGDRTGAAGYCATERIDLSDIPKPCTINLTKAKWAYDSTTETGYIMTCARDANGTNLVATYTNTSIGSDYFTVAADGTLKTGVIITVTSDEVAEICFSGHWAATDYSDSNVSLAAANTKATLTYTPES